MASRIFQGIVMQMKDASNRTIGVLDATSTIVACTDVTLIGTVWEDATNEICERNDSLLIWNDITFKPLSGWASRFDFAAFVSGSDDFAKSMCQLAAVALDGAKAFYDEKHDKSTFVKNILLDNVLPGDIYVRSRELHFEVEIPRVVFLVIQQNKPENTVVDVIQSLFPDRTHDFVVSLNESTIALIKEIDNDYSDDGLIKLAHAIQDTVKSEIEVATVIGIGTKVNNLKDLASSYKEAQLAIEVGKVFDVEKTIIDYQNLGIGRLVYQLPTTLCEMFLNEIFKESPIEALDEETLSTIQRFFANSLNVSETSRKLFVHRNTLVYRLEKIKKITGLDLREFDHAIVFKVALMVRKYLESTKANSIVKPNTSYNLK